MTADALTVRDLRRRWKPTKERLVAADANEALRIRFHRCCSWLQRVEAIEADDGPDDATLIFRWIALNALYGRWNAERHEPVRDTVGLDAFTRQLRTLDAEGYVRAALDQHRKLALSIFDDQYLLSCFWDDPSLERGRRTTRARHEAPTWYAEGHHARVLDELLRRIAFLRGQLVHGGATLGGKNNRTALRRCTTMLARIMPAILLVIIDYGADEDWGPICYPPLG